MFLIVIGAIVLIAGFAINTPALAFAKFSRPVKTIGVIVMVVGFLTACIKQIDAGTVGVQSLFGKISDGILTSGLNFVNPLVEVESIDVKTQNYTMSAVRDEGDKEGDDAIRVLTSDGL